MLASGRLLSSYGAGDLSSSPITAERWRNGGWKWKHTRIHHNTDLLRDNLCGQLVNNSLFHRVLQFVVAEFNWSQQERKLNEKWDTSDIIHIINIHFSTFSVVVCCNSVSNVGFLWEINKFSYILDYRIIENRLKAKGNYSKYCVLFKFVYWTYLNWSSRSTSSYQTHFLKAHKLCVFLWRQQN